MTRITLTTTLLLALAACNNSSNASTETKEEAKPTYSLAMLSDKTDHICGMELGEGSIADTAHYDGKVYGFCARECKAEFVKDPQTALSAQH